MRRNEKSIQKTLTLLFVISIIVPVFLNDYITSVYLKRDINKSYSREIENVVSSLDENLVIYFKQLETQIEMMSAYEKLKALIYSDADSGMQNVKLYKEVSRYINTNFGGRIDTAAISIYDVNQNLVISRNTNLQRSLAEQDSSIINSLKEMNYGCRYFGSRRLSYNGVSSYYLTLGCKIMDLDRRETIGYVIVDLNYNMIEQIAGWKHISGEFLLLLNNQIVYDNKDSSLIATQLKPEYLTDLEKNSEIHRFESEKTDWSYIIVSDRSVINSRIYTMLLRLIVISGICFLIFTVISRKIIHKVVSAINNLELSMQQAEDEGFNKIAAISGNTFREIRNLYSRFNVMQLEIQTLMESQKDLLRKKADMEYRALQMQITPHFLYNSLDSINCLAQIYGKDDISEMIISLADIFKYSTGSASVRVELCQEIKHVQDYCMLQAVRYQDRFKVEIDILPKYYHINAIKFMLQPLVENAIHYGVGKMKQNGLIRVGIEEHESDYCIYVWDNGENFDPKKKKEYLDLFHSKNYMLDYGVNEHGIGLYNVFCRLMLTYGEQADMNIDDRNGTKIEIYLPKEKVDVSGVDRG